MINKKLFMIPLLLAKAFFLAVTQVAWGLASMVFLNLEIVWVLKEEMTQQISTGFLRLEAIVFNHIMLFVMIFFIIYAYYDIKELTKKEEVKA